MEIWNFTVTESRDFTALEVEVKGSSIPLNVVLHPYAIYIPGQNLVGTTVKKLFAVSTLEVYTYCTHVLLCLL